MATDYLALARDAYDASTTYLDSNVRGDLEYSLKAFRNEHAPGSKYLSDEYKNRSRIFHPKTRSIIRKNEAAAMQAAFSNREMVSVEPVNPDDLINVAGADCLKEVMEYRLQKTIPTFSIYLGGVQDAQTTGMVCSYQYWEYVTKPDGTKLKDRPCIELRPAENMRFDAAASWVDIVESSPYLCDIVPMYICDVKALMNTKDDKTGSPKWKKYDDKIIALATPKEIDSTRQARLGNMQDPEDAPSGIKAFDIVWIMRWMMRDSQGMDNVFYTLGTEKLLTDPKPLEEVYFHGKRPYVMGYAILETHKAFKTSLPTLVRPLQQGINNVGNSRFDNVQFVLNKRWLVRRGSQTDVQSLVRNVPGGVTMTSNPKEDIQESNWADVTSSSYVEHDRFNSEFDDLAGNFSPSTKVANNAVNDTFGGSKLASAGASLMTEYMVRCINDSWWEKVMRQLALLEQYYETDEVILSICAKKAQLFPKFGMSRITDMLLMQETTVTVDMAYGDPMQRMQKFIMAIQSCIQIMAAAPPAVNVNEICKEIMSSAGFRDGARFFEQNQDPRLAKAMEALQQMKAMLEGKQMELQQQGMVEQAKLQSAEKQKAAQLQVDQQRIQGDLSIRQSELAIEAQRVQLEVFKIQAESAGQNQELTMRAAEMQSDIEAAQLKLEGERQKMQANAIKSAQDIQKSELELQKAMIEAQAATTLPDVANQVGEGMKSVATDITALRDALKDAQSSVGGVGTEVADLKKGLGALVSVVMGPKKKPVSIRGGKKDGKIIIKFDDDTEDTMLVQ